jgi:hypothetical protein
VKGSDSELTAQHCCTLRKIRVGRVHKLDPNAIGREQHEGREARDELVVSGCRLSSDGDAVIVQTDTRKTTPHVPLTLTF